MNWRFGHMFKSYKFSSIKWGIKNGDWIILSYNKGLNRLTMFWGKCLISLAFVTLKHVVYVSDLLLKLNLFWYVLKFCKSRISLGFLIYFVCKFF